MKENIKVLVIDDEVDFCYFVQKNLVQNGMFDVIIVHAGHARRRCRGFIKRKFRYGRHPDTFCYSPCQ